MFAYPQQAAFGRKVPKTKIYQHASPTKRVRDLFVSQIDRIIWDYKLAPETINLPARPGVAEIQIFTIHLRSEALHEDVLRCIDKSVIHPIFFRLRHGDRIRHAAAHKRPSDSDASKCVVGDYYFTDWTGADSTESKPALPVALDLTSLYAAMLRQLFPHPARDGESLHAQVERLAQLRQKQREAHKIEAALRREKQFNRKVELNTCLRDLQQAIDELKSAHF